MPCRPGPLTLTPARISPSETSTTRSERGHPAAVAASTPTSIDRHAMFATTTAQSGPARVISGDQPRHHRDPDHKRKDDMDPPGWIRVLHVHVVDR